MKKEKVGLHGKFRITCLRDNEVVAEREVTNTIMNAGLAEITGLMLNDVGGTAFDYLAVGTSATAPNATQTALVAEVYRIASTGSQETDSVSNDTARLTNSIAITASNTLQEAGIFNSSSAGTMLARATYSSLSVNDGDTLNIGYDITLS